MGVTVVLFRFQQQLFDRVIVVFPSEERLSKESCELRQGWASSQLQGGFTAASHRDIGRIANKDAKFRDAKVDFLAIHHQ